MLKIVSRGQPRLTQERMDTIIDRHYMWLDSDGGEGRCADFSDYDVSGLNFSGLNLSHAKFIRSKMDGAKFIGTALYQCWIINCSARGIVATDKAEFRQAEIKNTNFRYSDLSTADFIESSIHGCDFTVCKLEGADFRFARIGSTEIYCRRADFRGVVYV